MSNRYNSVMPTRNGPVHVATILRRYKGKVYTTHLLRRTYRENGEVKHETLGNISHLPEHVVEIVRGALRGETFVPASEVFEVMKSRPHGHVEAVLGMAYKLGLETLIASKPSR